MTVRDRTRGAVYAIVAAPIETVVDLCTGIIKQSEPLMSYARFATMIVASTVLMFALMYLNTYALDHVTYSQTRTWMALMMGAAMSVVMMGFMWSMYRNTRVNVAIVLASIALFAGALWLVRSQETVNDVSYMKAMIPHHSIAIMTSERAHIKDSRVRRLADQIIEAQVREIAQRKALIADLESRPPPDAARTATANPPCAGRWAVASCDPVITVGFALMTPSF